jgi:hypothetical protein
MLDSQKMSLHLKSLTQGPLVILELCHVITLTSQLSNIKPYAETGQEWVEIMLLTLLQALKLLSYINHSRGQVADESIIDYMAPVRSLKRNVEGGPRTYAHQIQEYHILYRS